MLSPTGPAIVTPRQYLTIDRAAKSRSEYRAGQMFAVPPSSIVHSRIGTSLSIALARIAQQHGGEAFGPNLRIGVTASGPFYYPAVSVVCGRPRTLGDDTLLNPVLVAEVVSRDLGVKLADYASMPSLMEILFISPDRHHAELHTRESGEWTTRTSTESGGAVEIPRLGCSISFAEVYRGC